MSAKEIKALIEVGTGPGYSGDELKQFITDERMRLDKKKERECEEREQERKRELERADKERAFKLDKIKVESEAKTAAEVERAKTAAEIE